MSNPFNPKNERIKKEYFRYQTEAKGKSKGTINGIIKAILRFETYTGFKDFRTFNKEQASAFKKHLAQSKTERTSEALSKSTLLSTVNALKDFFGWLGYRPGYKSAIHVPSIEYLNLSEKDTRIAKAGKFKDFPTIEQIHKVIFTMPKETDIERRNRAVVACAILTGMRDSAIASLRLKHINLELELVKQEPDQVKTKFSKRIDTFFFPIGEDIKNVFIDWIKELIEQKLYGLNNPVFPKTKLGLDHNQSFEAQGLEATCWTTATPIREIFKKAFTLAGIPYFIPHSFRRTLTHLGQTICRSPEEFKAWSQNLGHEHVMTTLSNYGNLSTHRQGEVIQKLSHIEQEENKLDLIWNELKSRK